MTKLNEMMKKDIEKSANELLETSGMKGRIPVNTVKLAQYFGFTVGNATLSDEEDGFILINNKTNTRIIGVNRERTAEFKRFIIAHELGHFKMKYNESEYKIFAQREKKHGRNDEENDTDYFAACLLMPREEFKCEYEKQKDKSITSIVRELSEIFRVPEESVLRRLQEVDLISLR